MGEQCMLEYTVSSSTVSLAAAVSARRGSSGWLHHGQQGSSTSTLEMRKSPAASGCDVVAQAGNSRVLQQTVMQSYLERRENIWLLNI